MGFYSRSLSICCLWAEAETMNDIRMLVAESKAVACRTAVPWHTCKLKWGSSLVLVLSSNFFCDSRPPPPATKIGDSGGRNGGTRSATARPRAIRPQELPSEGGGFQPHSMLCGSYASRFWSPTSFTFYQLVLLQLCRHHSVRRAHCSRHKST